MGADGSDVIVVGGGAAGCVVARRLAEAGDRSVLLLEAGPDLGNAVQPALRDGWRLPTGPDWTFDWGFESEPDEAGATVKLRRGRLLGGTSWLTRFAVRGARADFDAWAARGNPGWAYGDVLPLFRRLESDAEFGDQPWHGSDGPLPVSRYPDLPRSAIHAAAVEAFAAVGFPSVDDHNRPDAVGVGPMPMSTRDGRRVTALDAYLRSGIALPGLRVRADAPVETVIVESQRVVGVRLAGGNELRADRVVLAGGTYGSPTILLRSGIGSGPDLAEFGMRVLVDLPGVGRNLADHPAVDLDTGWRGDATSGPVLHSIATLRSDGSHGDAPDLMFWISDPEGDEPALYLDPILLKPDSRGSVRLGSPDPADPPRITLPGLREPRDLARLAEAYRIGLELAHLPAFRGSAGLAAPSDPGTPESLRRRIIENAYSIPHVVGTCRMGPSPADGDVVDAHGRVYGIDGLWVIDASVIPEPPSGFPHVITLMLAEHLSPSVG